MSVQIYFKNNFQTYKKAIKNILKKTLYGLKLILGFDPDIIKTNVSGLRWYYKDYKEIKRQLKDNKDFTYISIYPIMVDKFAPSGFTKNPYFQQDLLVAQQIFANKPLKHVDIGSRVDGFVAHVATYRDIEIFDIRPLNAVVKNVSFVQADLMQPDEKLTEYTDSISSLHAIEHFGLGRYNDPIDAFGHIKALDNIYKILKPRGRFYFSTPIGSQRVEFNAHRVFSVNYLLSLFVNKYEIIRFSYIDDLGVLYDDVSLESENANNNFNCVFGCGIFELIKL